MLETGVSREYTKQAEVERGQRNGKSHLQEDICLTPRTRVN